MLWKVIQHPAIRSAASISPTGLWSKEFNDNESSSRPPKFISRNVLRTTWHHVSISNHYWIYYTNELVKQVRLLSNHFLRFCVWHMIWKWGWPVYSYLQGTCLTEPKGCQNQLTQCQHQQRCSCIHGERRHECDMSGKQPNLFELKLRNKNMQTDLNATCLASWLNDWHVQTEQSQRLAASPLERSSHAVRSVSTLQGNSVSHWCISVGCGFRRYVLV